MAPSFSHFGISWRAARWPLAAFTASSLALLPSSLAAPASKSPDLTPAPTQGLNPNDIPDTTSILEMEASPEEKMIYGDMPAVPESGSENPEDLLTSSPLARPDPKPKKSASAKGADGMPTKLREIPSSRTAAPAAEDLPPLPSVPYDTAVESPSEVSELSVEAAGESEPLPEAPGGTEVMAADSPSWNGDGISAKRWDRSVPMYDRENPNWGVDIHGSLQALGATGIATENAAGIVDHDIRNFGFGVEYEPEFLQSIGVVSIGPSANLYVASPSGELTSGAFSIMSAGMSAKYQLKFWRGQPLVPFFGYEIQMIKYRFEVDEIGSGITTAQGPVFGAMLLLNWMEPSAAHSLWADTGIKRTYLVGEMKMLTAGEPLLSVDGQALYFGLRMEL
jgi:hypothetical protein